jgi:hypothetical protein
MKAKKKTIQLARLMTYWRTFIKDPKRILCIKDFGLMNGRIYVETLLKLGLITTVPIYVSTGKKHRARILRTGYVLKDNSKVNSSSLIEKKQKTRRPKNRRR